MVTLNKATKNLLDQFSYIRSLHESDLDVFQCRKPGKKEKEIIEKWSPSVRLWTFGIRDIDYQKKNTMIEINTKEQCFPGEFWLEKD